MSLPNELHPLQLAASSGGYEIEQSLRFDGSSYLSWTDNITPDPVARDLWTLSVWIKRGALGGSNQTFFSAYQNDNNRTRITLASSGDLLNAEERGAAVSKEETSTNNVFRDPSAWFHLVYLYDVNAPGGSGDYIQFWINGVRASESNAARVDDWAGVVGDNGTTHNIGRVLTSSPTDYFNGYLAEMHLCPGLRNSPSDYGETDPNTGAWIPKLYTGTYGTHGYYLKFDPTATNGIGHDHSGNGNNFTASGFTTSGTGTDVMSDTPTTNWCTFNPLANAWSNTGTGSVADGNLYLSYSSGNWFGKKGTMAVSSGKWYYEWTNTSGGTSSQCGFTTIESASETGSGVYRYRSDGNKINTSYTSYAATWSTAGDIIGIALDIDAGTIVFYKNGVSQGTAFSSIPAGTYIPECVMEGAGYTGYANFGQRAFAYTPPTGYKALNTQNLPEPTIKDGSQYFNTVLYTGTGSAQSISGVGFQPDLVWSKGRSTATNHHLFDVVRGVYKELNSNGTNAEGTDVQLLTAFNADGFSLGTNSGVNNNGTTFASWNWKGGGTGSSNNAGTISSTVSANASAGFSIVTYTGTGANATVGHGLGVAPKMIIFKNRDELSHWDTYHASIGATKRLQLSSTDAATTLSTPFNDTEPTSTVFSVGTNLHTNGSGDKLVAYCFSEVAGYSKFGSYTGNGSSDGPFVFCGFRPAYILVKNSNSSTDEWEIYDTARDPYNFHDKGLRANTSGAEYDLSSNNRSFDTLSNGFKVRGSNAGINGSGNTHIFAAFAELPFKYANAR